MFLQPVSNQVSEEQVPLKICRGKDDITTFFKVPNKCLIFNDTSCKKADVTSHETSLF